MRPPSREPSPPKRESTRSALGLPQPSQSARSSSYKTQAQAPELPSSMPLKRPSSLASSLSSTLPSQDGEIVLPSYIKTHSKKSRTSQRSLKGAGADEKRKPYAKKPSVPPAPPRGPKVTRKAPPALPPSYKNSKSSTGGAPVIRTPSIPEFIPPKLSTANPAMFSTKKPLSNTNVDSG